MTTIDIEAALKIAAGSPDPKVRRMANNYVAVEAKLAASRTFLTYYVNAETELSDESVTIEEVKTKRGPKKAGVVSSGGRRKSTVLLDVLRQILIDKGEPMKVDEMYSVLTDKHKENAPVNVESLRARLTKFKATIRRVDQRGWWPTDLPVPSAN